MSRWRVGVDSGGTFTDICLFDEQAGRIETWKVPSTPDDPSRGIAQGVGQALWEGAIYSDEGQLLTGSMLDYPLPKASGFPNFELAETVTPSPVNPIGVKGVGEIGITGVAAAISDAVWHATGKRLRSTPILAEALLGD